MVRESVRNRSRIRIGARYAWAERVAHFAAFDIPGKLPIYATIHARCRATHRKGFRYGWRCYLYGTSHTARLGKRLYSGGYYNAIYSKFVERTWTYRESKEVIQRIQQVLSWCQHVFNWLTQSLCFCSGNRLKRHSGLWWKHTTNTVG